MWINRMRNSLPNSFDTDQKQNNRYRKSLIFELEKNPDFPPNKGIE